MNVLIDTNILLDFIQHKEINAEFIITRNVDDYKESEIKAITPYDFLNTLKSKQ